MQKGYISQDYVFKSHKSNNLTISGYASVFDVEDSQNDIISKGAFKNIEATNVKLLWQHDATKPIGIIKSLQEDDYGLRIQAEINTASAYGKEAAELIKQGAIDGLSIGFAIKSSDYQENGTRLIDAVDLMEVSIVTFPANKKAAIKTIEKNQKQNTKIIKINNLNLEGNNMKSLEINTNNDMEQKTAFNNFIRKGIESDLITKSYSSGNDSAGALVTPQLHKQIISAIEAKSTMRNLASVESISTRALDMIIEQGSFASGWIGEVEARGDTNNSKLIKKTINAHEIFAQPKATQNLIDDSEINVESWLAERIADSFARLENEAFINGDGENKPTGLLQNKDIETLDLSKNKDSSATPETLLNLTSMLDEGHLQRASFLMNRKTLSAFQGVKDKTGRFIWQQSMNDPLHQTIFGVPVFVSSNMPNLGEGKCSIAFGDFKAAYKIVDRSGISLLRDPYTEKPFIRFYATKRVGGDVVNASAMKFAKV